MGNKLRLLIADDEYLICNMLVCLIDFDGLGLELAGTIHDGKSLLQEIEAQKPDIVITDICMPGCDGIEVIRQTRERGLECKFIIISGYRQFEYAYNALKYDVEDYILKPVDEVELNAALSRIAGIIRKDAQDDLRANRSPWIVPLIIAAVKDKHYYSLEDFNVAWNLNLHDGQFRIAFLRLDCLDNLSRSGEENLESLMNKIREVLLHAFTPVCYEVVLEPKTDGARILLNYAADQEQEIRLRIKTVYQKIRELLSLFWGISETICISDAVSDIRMLEELVNQARAGEWARMALGVDRIIYFSTINQGELEDAETDYTALEKKIRIAFDTLNEAEFKDGMEAFFSMPQEELMKSAACYFLRHIKNLFFQGNQGKISEYTDYENLYQQFSHSLHMCTTFSKYKYVFISGICRIMQQISAIQNSKNARPIVLAIAYIEQNYSKPLYLESVAEEVGLSTVYLSNLFKKETGKNFTDYVTEYRLQIASNLLKNSILNVSEIANSVGFSDGRYFSKQFKRFFGIKPTEYRKLYR